MTLFDATLGLSMAALFSVVCMAAWALNQQRLIITKLTDRVLVAAHAANSRALLWTGRQSAGVAALRTGWQPPKAADDAATSPPDSDYHLVQK